MPLIGTAHFVNRNFALQYYRPYNERGTNAKEVTRKEKAGEIAYGPPELKVEGDTYTVRGGQYFIVAPDVSDKRKARTQAKRAVRDPVPQRRAKPDPKKNKLRNPKLEADCDCTNASYAVCIDDYEADVCDLDSLFHRGFNPFHILDAVNDVDSVDFNGHFGNIVYFRVEGHTERKRNAIKNRFLRVLHQVLLRVPAELKKAQEE